MPYDDPDETDPMMLIGVELPTSESSWHETAQVFAEEFARMGFDEERLMRLFKDPFYTGAHQALLMLGEERVLAIVRETTAVWGSVRVRERDTDPSNGMMLLPVIDVVNRNPHA